jgi:hypothetical protein
MALDFAVSSTNLSILFWNFKFSSFFLLYNLILACWLASIPFCTLSKSIFC